MRRPRWGPWRSRETEPALSERASRRLDVLLPEDGSGWVPWQDAITPVLPVPPVPPVLPLMTVPPGPPGPVARGDVALRSLVDLHTEVGLLELSDELPPLPHLRQSSEPVRRVPVEPVERVAAVEQPAQPVVRRLSAHQTEPPAVSGVEPAPVTEAGTDRPLEPALRWGFLPSTVRGGRVDPGRSGALALVAVAVVAALVAGVVLLRGRPEAVPAPKVLASGMPVPESSAPTTGDGQVVVSVAGKVRRPGVVRLPLGARVDDAVRAAGGVAPGASAGLLNLARRLIDGEQVLVGIEAAPGAVGAVGAPGEGLVDLNTATTQQLEQLPGVGPVLAERIVAWRTEHGRFASVDQLREVSGIGESKYAGLKAKVRV